MSLRLSKDFKNLPPAVIINIKFDPLLDYDVLYANKLRKSGVKVWGKCFTGQIHMLLGLVPNATEIKELRNYDKISYREKF